MFFKKIIIFYSVELTLFIVKKWLKTFCKNVFVLILVI